MKNIVFILALLLCHFSLFASNVNVDPQKEDMNLQEEQSKGPQMTEDKYLQQERTHDIQFRQDRNLQQEETDDLQFDEALNLKQETELNRIF